MQHSATCECGAAGVFLLSPASKARLVSSWRFCQRFAQGIEEACEASLLPQPNVPLMAGVPERV